MLYYHDCYSNEIQQGSTYPQLCPFGNDTETYNAVFNNAGNLLNRVFTYASSLGIQNCVGTETPITLPPGESCNGPICALRTYYSVSRQDHFVTTTPCEECDNFYQYVRPEGWVSLKPTSIFNTALSTCYSGTLEDNILVVGTTCPSGYGFVRTAGYASSVNTTYNGTRMIPLVTYYDASMKDHWVLANATSIKDATSMGYTVDAQSKIVYVLSNGEQPDIPVTNSTLKYYEGIFNRISAKYPIDWYWLWTPENWEWSHVSVNDPIVNQTITDVNTAYEALKNVDADFNLATCGWVIGPDGNRSYLNGYLPTEIVMSSIDVDLGRVDPDPAYAIISKDRTTWDIPWMEDDPDLTALQLWVNRTMDHAIIAKSYGVSGLLGIHWRTQEISPQISALSMMGWNTTNEYGERHKGLSPQTSLEFWTNWVSTEFNLTDSSVIESMGTLWNEEIDSVSLPDGFNGKLPMQGCPGILKANAKPWSTVSQYYTFVDKFNGYKASVNGMEAMERFNYWSNMLEYIRMMGKVGVDWGNLGKTVTSEILLNDTAVMINYLMAAMTTKGTMGTLTNIQQQLIPKMIWTNKLKLPTEYNGVTRMWVMSPRSMFSMEHGDGQQYDIEIMILSKTRVVLTDITVYYRELTSNGNWNTLNNIQLRGDKTSQVYLGSVAINTDIINAKGFEYYVEAKADSMNLRWPIENSFTVSVQ